MSDLLSRAQQARLARADLTIADLTLVLLGVARTMAITGQRDPGQWRRHLAIVLVPHAVQRLPGLPPSPEQLDRDLREWSGQLLRGSSVVA